MEVFSNSAISLDGRLGTARYDHLRLGSEEDLRRMGQLRAHADAILVGGRTWRAWSLPLVEPEGGAPRGRPLVNAVLTRKGLGPREGRFFGSPRTRPVILGGPDADLAGFPDGTAVHRSQGPATVAWALGVLEREYAVRRLLVEGGGDLVAQLLEVGLLHELFVTLCPILLGGRGAPSLVDGPGLPVSTLPRLELRSQERVGDELFLRYRVTRRG